MAILQDIQAGNRYQGSSILGGGIEQLIELDYKPIQQLAQYTYLYNKSLFDQRQKDADEKIKQLASLTAYDLVNGMGKDKEAVIKAQADLTNYMADFAAKGTPKTPKEKIQQQLDFQTKIKDVTKLINAANTRAIGYMAQKELIDKDATLNAAQKDNLLKDLDKQFNDTDIYTPIQALPKFKPQSTDAGGASYKETAVVKVGDNGVVEEKVKIFDPQSTKSKSILSAGNFNIPELPANATEAQKQEHRQRLLSGDINTVWASAANNYAAALTDPNYKKTITIAEPNVTGEPAVTKLTDEIDYTKIKETNPIMGGIFGEVDRWNAYALKMKEAGTTTYIDAAGNIKPLAAINPDDYFLIDKSKPLEGWQLAFIKNFADSNADKIEKNYTNTGAAIQRENNLLDYKIQKQNANTAWYNAHKGDTKGGEPAKFMDLTGYKGTLTTADIAAIDPTLVVSESGVLKLTPEGQKATFKILDNGDVEVNYNNGKAAAPKSKFSPAIPEVTATIKVINKDKYQKESVAITQTVLKDRKGEEGNPFTFTGLGKDNKPDEKSMDYYNNESNMKSRKGNTITYKDGTVWIYDEKTGTLNPKK